MKGEREERGAVVCVPVKLCCKYCDCVSGECGWSVGRTGEGYSSVVVGGNYAL